MALMLTRAGVMSRLGGAGRFGRFGGRRSGLLRRSDSGLSGFRSGINVMGHQAGFRSQARGLLSRSNHSLMSRPGGFRMGARGLLNGSDAGLASRGVLGKIKTLGNKGGLVRSGVVAGLAGGVGVMAGRLVGNRKKVAYGSVVAGAAANLVGMNGIGDGLMAGGATLLGHVLGASKK